MAHLHKWSLLAALVGLALVVPTAGADPVLPAGFQTQTVASGIYSPVDFAPIPGDSQGRIIVLEKDGIIDIWRNNGTQKRILDYYFQVSSFHDRGMLGVTLDKDFATNHYIYVVYDVENQTDPAKQDGELPTTARLSRFTVDLTTGNESIDPASEHIVLGASVDSTCGAPAPRYDCIPNDYPWHSIGTVKTDTDGTLWLGVGDGVESNTYKTATQRTFNTDSLAGKILHIKTDGTGISGHPFCAGDTDLTKNCTKVYAKGFRNPYRFSIRPGKGPIVGDVGEGRWEEIDLVKPGANYGWPCYEGPDTNPVYASAAECQQPGLGTLTPPSYYYAHDSNGGGSAEGGPLFTGAQYPAGYQNSIFIYDYAQQWIKRMTVDSNDTVTGVFDFATNAGLPVDLQVGSDGNLWSVDIGYTNGGFGGITKYIYSPTNNYPVARYTHTVTGASLLTLSVNGGTSTDPDNDALSYVWDWGDGTTDGTGLSTTHLYTTVGNYTVTLTVDDGHGGSNTTSKVISVGNHAPTAAISAPTAATTFTDGETINLSGSGNDLDGDAVTLSWHVLLQHGAHVHDYGTFTGSPASFKTGDDHDIDGRYQITLTATDSHGATGTTTVMIQPKTVTMRLTSSPPGAPVIFTQTSGTAPFDRSTVPGFETSISAAPTWTSGDRTYNFLGWSDGGAATHTVTVPSTSSTLTANYNAAPDAAATAKTATAPLAVAFDGTGSSDPDGDGLAYTWDFGDGQTGSGATTPHVYALAGSYTVTLTVSDGRGGSTTTTVTATAANAAVQQPPPTTAPPVTTGAPPPPPVKTYPIAEVTLAKSGVRSTGGGSVRIKLRNRNAVASIGVLEMRSSSKLSVSGTTRKKTVAFGETAFIVASGKSHTVTIKLSKANRTLLDKLRKIKVRVSFDAHDKSGRKGTGSASSTLLAPRR